MKIFLSPFLYVDSITCTYVLGSCFFWTDGSSGSSYTKEHLNSLFHVNYYGYIFIVMQLDKGASYA